jgi:signal peptide peptidase SppA
MRSYEHVLGFALSHPWNIEKSMLPVIAGILARRIAGHDADPAAIQAALVDRKNLPQPRAGSIAIIPVYGVLAPRMNMMTEMSGGTTYEKLTSQLRGAMADKTIKTIVFDVDSGGGSVAGNAEFAAEVLRARAKKPIIAQAQYLMGSAAYQLSSVATEVVAAPSARVGSIGSYMIHDDLSKALEMEGIKTTYISAGEGKVDGNETEPLSDAARARMEALVNGAYEQFVGNVVKGRGKGMTADKVRNEWKAYVYSASEALSMGMIDRIATLDETLARILSASPDSEDQRAAETIFSPIDATDQELPAMAATSQERMSELALERALFELNL